MVMFPTAQTNSRTTVEEINSGFVHRPGHELAPSDEHARIHEGLKEFIQNGHPCVGASAALKRGEYWHGIYGRMDGAEDVMGLARDLFQYLRDQEAEPREFGTFLATFKGPKGLTEEEFETLLWRKLGELDQISSVFYPWDPTVSPDPESPQFSFSFAGKAFYVVGLHQGSSRMARSFEYPTLVFNLHSQFEKLRASGKYDRMRDTIRSRDEKLQGSVNPMLNDFGKVSEARQYSGRKVDEGWKCPFHAVWAKDGK